ncbi:hypothetical protein HXX76_014672 [Chlamydomonas incerta]|uniref:Saposin B-type domain-containing protein n=1 Tax=Chlamydomonas incerta TaxID=51695 RepID=A0A835SL24_CHLIN|nr:hypothetical protein HXX76_014672 [Chlamydomonas incerta]|eukprot:KAG2424294.1 hypothetical protein HXX76_014672 [Chlamydomonas incerta]
MKQLRGALALAVLLASSSGVSAARAVAAGAVNKPGVGDQVCDTCLIAMRLMEDALCDDGAVTFVVDLFEKQLCPATPDQVECQQLVEALIPVAMEWLRASETPASLCAAVGVCGAALLGDPTWDRKHGGHLQQLNAKAAAAPHGSGSGTLRCATCRHVVDSVKAAADARGEDGEGGLTSPADAHQAAWAACAGLPAPMAAACSAEVDKRSAIILLAVGGPAADRDTAEACGLLGMCGLSLASAALEQQQLRGSSAHGEGAAAVAGLLGSRRLPPLPPVLAKALAAAWQGRLGLARTRLEAALGSPALRDTRCTACKMAVTEVSLLLTDPAVQGAVLAYAEAICDVALPSAYTPACRSAVDAYAPVLFALLPQYVQPDPVCVRLGMCTAPSAWEQLVLGGKAAAAAAAAGGNQVTAVANLP